VLSQISIIIGLHDKLQAIKEYTRTKGYIAHGSYQQNRFAHILHKA